MRKSILLLSFIGLIFASCTKEGPTGPAGPAGANATVKCTECHNSSTFLFAAEFQYQKSGHYLHWVNEPATSCAVCHTNEGFNEFIQTGNENTAAEIVNPTPQSCYTCHTVHTNFDATDLLAKTTAPVALRFNKNIVVDAGKGNLCINCHQPRALSVPNTISVSLLTANNTDTVLIKSSRYGPHHGGQGTMVTGKGAFELAGSTPYTNSAHTNIQDACITCHMAKPIGNVAGGHSLWAVYIDPEEQELSVNVAGCVDCHVGITPANMMTKIEDTKADIDALLAELKGILVAKGWLNANTDLIIATSSNPLKVTAEQAKVIYNYKFVEEDQTSGVHNYNYAKAVLMNSIEIAQNW